MCVDIVIVNWNSETQLADCVSSIEKFGGGIVDLVSIVDNGSTDNSLRLGATSVEVRLVELGYNAGFARACNIGARTGIAPYILFLNPDARLLPNGLQAAIAYMESPVARDVAICGVRLLNENGHVERSCARFPTWRTYVGKVLGLSRLLPHRFPLHFMVEFDHLSGREVDQVIGAFFLVRRDVFEALGGFDERFFVYFEELDFSLRARRAGWRTWFLGEATAFHKGNGTTDQVKAHRLFYSLRSRILYAFKHFPAGEAWLVAVTSLVIEPIVRLLRAGLNMSRQELYDTWRGVIMLWRDLPRILKTVRS